MNIQQWLQARREGCLSAIPLGMLAAMAASGDENSIHDIFLNGYGIGPVFLYQDGSDGCRGYGDGGGAHGDGDGDGSIWGTGNFFGCGYGDHGNGDGYGNINGYDLREGNSVDDIVPLTQRFF